MISSEDIDHWFGYHPAGEEKKKKYAAIENKAKELARLIVATCPDNEDTRYAVLRLREAKMMAVASIACHNLDVR